MYMNAVQPIANDHPDPVPLNTTPADMKEEWLSGVYSRMLVSMLLFSLSAGFTWIGRFIYNIS